MSNYCLVEGCRFPQFHLTSGHQCICGLFGHGRIECHDRTKKSALKLRSRMGEQSLPVYLQCTIQGCRHSRNHTNQSHVCSYCHQLNHELFNCPSRPLEQPTLEQNRSQLSNLTSTNVTSTQEPMYHITCPLCKVVNTVPKSQKPVVGSHLKCVVCLEEQNSFVFLPQCGHTNVCLDCINLIDQITNSTINYFASDSSNDDEINGINMVSTPPQPQILPSSTINILGTNPIFYIPLVGNLESDFSLPEVQEAFGSRDGKLVLCSAAGMGCCNYIRRDHINARPEFFFMHSDDWGQYGFSRVRELNAFVEGYEPLINSE